MLGGQPFGTSDDGGSNVGINELFGDGTAGPGDGAQEFTLTNLAVTTGKIADGAVTTDKIDDAAVDNDKLAPEAVTIDKMAASSVGSSQILNNAVEYGKLQYVIEPGGAVLGALATGPVVEIPFATLGGVLLLEDVDLVAAATHATPTWVANAYKKIIIELYGRIAIGGGTETFVTLNVNADTGNNYQHQGSLIKNGAFVESSPWGVNGYSVVGAYHSAIVNGYSLKIEFYPETTGFERMGRAHSEAADVTSAVLAASAVFDGGFMWKNTANDVTSLTLGFLDGGAFTGNCRVWGQP